MNLGVLVKTLPSPPGDPQQIPGVEVAARWIREQGGLLLYTEPSFCWVEGERMFARGWSPMLATHSWCWHESVEIHAVYNRFPASRDPQGLQKLARQCQDLGLPIANHPVFQTLVQDKWKTAQLLEQARLPTPPSVLSLSDMISALQEWRYAFLKPRYGAFGEQIYVLSLQQNTVQMEGPTWGQRVSMPLEHWVSWLEQQVAPESMILQQGVVLPVSSWCGFSVRSLLQRTPSSQWYGHPRVARISTVDPVANVARGARAMYLPVCLAEFCDPSETEKLCADAQCLEQQIVQALLQALPACGLLAVVEMGIDLILDQDKTWWILEINGFPQGRLRSLAQQDPGFQWACDQVHTLPLQTLMQAASCSSL